MVWLLQLNVAVAYFCYII
uniref:Uncharacterized protein n=1 Tax=Anguilla anguilla TaxID=7936 RepID=A0A0E9S8X7_ANGAN